MAHSHCSLSDRFSWFPSITHATKTGVYLRQKSDHVTLLLENTDGCPRTREERKRLSLAFEPSRIELPTPTPGPHVKNSFSGMRFTHQTVRPRDVYNSTYFSKFTELFDHHHNRF